MNIKTPKETAEYILNHYDKKSKADAILLARHLHYWAKSYTKKYRCSVH